MKQSRTSHIGVVLFFAVVAFCSPLFFFGCGGAGGDDPIVGGPTLNSLHITGRVVNQSGALPNISAAILPAVPLSGCEVYLESVPTIKTVTDTNGRFTLTPVPAGSHRVVARWLSGAQLFKVRSQVLSVGGANAEANAGDLLAESATYQVKGILKDGQGNPVSGTPMSLWGEVFYTNAQGVYESPLMPGNSEGVISVQNPQYKPIELEFVFSSPNPPYVETVMVPAGQTNRAPDVRVFMNAYSVNAGLQVSLIASATDPDGDQLSYFWSASAGSISTGTSPAQPNWTAPTEGSIATIAVEVRDPGGLSAKYLVQVTILGSGRENTPPRITARFPAPNATGVPLISTVTVSFNETIDASSLNTGNFLLKQGTNPVPGAISFGSLFTQGTFTPAAPLSSGMTYTVELTTGIRDTAGNSLAAKDSWQFTIASSTDSTPPTIVSVVPDNLATDVSTGTLVTANFTEAMNASTINVTTFTLASGTSPITGAIFVSGDGMSATFTPAVSLPLGSVIVATITTGVQDLSGNPMSTSKVWAFTTAIEVDLTAPTMVAIVPASGEINVATNTAVTIAFSESMDPTTLNTTSITLASDGIGISGSVTVSGDSKVATFTPTGALPYGSAIAVTISTGAKDLAGNPLAANVVRVFTTTTAPATPAPLLITEVSSSRFSDSFRWIEIYNTTGASIDLGNYQLRSLTIPRTGGSTTGPVLFVIPALSVPANSYAVVRVKGSDTDIFDGTNLVHIFGAGDMLPYWGADGFVELVDASNQTVDFVRWGADTTAPQTSSKWVSGAAPALPDAYGSSLARPFALDDTDTGADWALRSFPTPGGPNDVSSDTDADVDGIPDVCEQSGATYMGLPVYDWGARVSQKDVFIHIDYMNSVDLGVNPRKDSLDNVVQVFAAHGYTLHPDVGTLFGSGVANHNLDNLSHQIAFSQFLYLGVEAGAANLYEIKATRLPLPKRHLFYYCIFASEQNSGSTGLGEVDGNDFLVSLGNQGFSTATQEDTNFLVHIMAATFMHELGHNLGLYHGGDDPNNNYKPNYLSIMNYLYSNLGVPQVGNPREGDRYYHNQWANDGFAATSAFYQYFSVSGSMQIHNSPWTASFTMDYSYGSGTTLTESNLTESEGLKYPITAGVDWNGNGNVTDPAFSKDVNLSGGSIESYNDYNDWGNLNFIFQQKYQGISNAPGGKIKRPYSFTNSDAQEIADEPPVTLPHRLMK